MHCKRLSNYIQTDVVVMVELLETEFDIIAITSSRYC
jgi:hypothetical protein